MKRKTWVSLAALVLVFAVGTSAFAFESDWSFEKMLPQMKQMHPEFTDEQLEDMYQSCHGENGNMEKMNQNENMKNMMNPA